MEPIVIGDTHVDPDDLQDMNITELVALCRLAESSAHRGVQRKTLISILKGKKRKVHNRVDEYRHEIVGFLESYWETVRSQVDLKCHGNCYAHTDFQVVTCWKTNKDTMEKHS